MEEIERFKEELSTDLEILKKISDFTRSIKLYDKIFDLMDETNLAEDASALEKCHSSIYDCILCISREFSKKNMDLVSHPCIDFSEDLLDILLEKYIHRGRREYLSAEEKEMPF